MIGIKITFLALALALVIGSNPSFSQWNPYLFGYGGGGFGGYLGAGDTFGSYSWGNIQGGALAASYFWSPGTFNTAWQIGNLRASNASFMLDNLRTDSLSSNSGSSRIHVESNAEVYHFRTLNFLTGYQVQDSARWEIKI